MKGDLVRKLANLGARGVHKQNAERDLQRTISSFGHALSAKIETIRVHLWDPKDSCIYEDDLAASRQHSCRLAPHERCVLICILESQGYLSR